MSETHESWMDGSHCRDTALLQKAAGPSQGSWRHGYQDFLNKFVHDIPVTVEAIQIDGGSEFESECQKRGIAL